MFLNILAEWTIFMPEEYIISILKEQKIEYSGLKAEKMNLEDTFIGLTGKY